MNWFVIALVGPVMYAVANHTDKYLLTRFVRHGEVGAMVIFSAIFSVVALPVVIAIQPDVFEVSLGRGVLLALNGTLLVAALLCYFCALHEDEASFVVPLYQTIPIFGFILGYVLLQETISGWQALASLIIITGALILSFDVAERIRFKKKVVLWMLAASFCAALNGVLFKVFALDAGFWPATFWTLIGKICMGTLLFAFAPTYRKQFLELFRANSGPVLGLNALSESLFIIGEASMAYASLLAPVALVLLVNSLQPLFVLVLGVLLSLFAPAISRESITRKQLAQKLLGTATILFGTLFIGQP
jgi:drug/metabolite transporter (DMT)-like permease